MHPAPEVLDDRDPVTRASDSLFPLAPEFIAVEHDPRCVARRSANHRQRRFGVEQFVDGAIGGRTRDVIFESARVETGREEFWRKSLPRDEASRTAARPKR